MTITDPHGLAVLFHDTYERLAPDFGYETRPETKTFDPSTSNGRLMIAVCEHVLESMMEYLTQKYLHRVREFHPRAWELMRSRKPFIAIAYDEPYYLYAYSMIRTQEKINGTWTEQDEIAYLGAEEYKKEMALQAALHTKEA